MGVSQSLQWRGRNGAMAEIDFQKKTFRGLGGSHEEATRMAALYSVWYSVEISVEISVVDGWMGWWGESC